MQYSFAIALVVTCLLFKFARSSVEIANEVNYVCAPDKFYHCAAQSRKKRFLIFDKGAALSISASAVKSVISPPRGLNLVNEVTVYYELPYSSRIPSAKPSVPSKPSKPSWTKYKNKPKKTLPNYVSVWPEHSDYHRDKRSVNSDSIFDSQTIASMFFQQINRLADMYGYNGRHCIMRTICEAQHFLFPKGESLFHDIIRIILKFSYPIFSTDKKLLAASKVKHPRDCANLYGPHCRISFLDYFTVQIHGKFM